VRVADLPDGVKEPPLTKDILGAEGYRKLYGDGVLGGPYKVDDSILNEIFDVAVQDIFDLFSN